MLQEVSDILCYSATFLVYLWSLLEQLWLFQWHRRSWSSSMLLASEWGLSKLNIASRKASAPVAGKTAWTQGILLNLIRCEWTPTFGYWLGYWDWESRLQLRKCFLEFGSAEVWGGVGGSQQCHNPPDVPLRSPHSPPPPKPAVCPQNTPSVTADMWKDSKELRAV